MPQPLSRVHPTLGFVLSGTSPFSPEMAKSAFSVIHYWSHIEAIYNTLIAKIAHGDPVTVAAIYNAVISGDAKRAALIAAAKSALPPETASLIQATLEAAKASRDDRNDLAHGTWGSLNSRPDCVLLFSPKDTAIWLAQFQLTMSVKMRSMEPPELDRSTIMVWKLGDFQDAEALALKRHGQIGRLPHLLGNNPPADTMRSKLLEDPQIVRLHEHYLRENSR